MFLDRLFDSTTTRALQLRASFAEKRQQLLAENIANIDTPGYRARRVDPAAFSRALQEAVDTAERRGDDDVQVTSGPARTSGPNGGLELFATTEPTENVILPSEASARLETLIVTAQQNAMEYATAIQLLRNKNDGLMTAIRGRSQ